MVFHMETHIEYVSSVVVIADFVLAYYKYLYSRMNRCYFLRNYDCYMKRSV